DHHEEQRGDGGGLEGGGFHEGDRAFHEWGVGCGGGGGAGGGGDGGVEGGGGGEDGGGGEGEGERLGAERDAAAAEQGAEAVERAEHALAGGELGDAQAVADLFETLTLEEAEDDGVARGGR